MKRIRLTLILCLTASSGLALSWLNGCADMCGNTVSKMVLSPNGALKAVVFQRDCGATTGFSTQVSVLSAQTTLRNDGGNVFVEDTGSNVDVTWQGNRSLRIQHQPTPFKSEKQIQVSTGWFRDETVTIDYAP